MAVTGCAPTVSVLLEQDAVPAATVPVQIVVAPSLKVIVPVGVPAPGAVTETVEPKDTDCPETLGFGVEVGVLAVVLALLTTKLIAGLLVLAL